MSAAILRPAQPGDAGELARFAQDAFIAAFGHFTGAEDMAAFFAESRSEATFAEALSDPATRVQIALLDGRIGGYCLIVLGRGFVERPHPQPARPVYLSQLYCGAETTGRGIGGALADWAIAESRAWGADAVQLSVWSGNHGAQRFYQRRGFAKVADIYFWVGSQRDEEFLYELAL